jgi:hypothetical protein
MPSLGTAFAFHEGFERERIAGYSQLVLGWFAGEVESDDEDLDLATEIGII